MTAIADSLRYSLEPLTEADRAAGAEPLTKEQIQEELDQISQVVTFIALQDLRAESFEWYAANDAIGEPEPAPGADVQRH